MLTLATLPLIPLLALISALPAPDVSFPHPAHGFSIAQVAGPRILKSGPVEVAKAYRKYAATVPSNIALAASAALADAAAAQQSGSVQNNPTQYDEQYLSPVNIGTPPSTYLLDFDTGSADLYVVFPLLFATITPLTTVCSSWVFSTGLPASQSAGHSPLYNPAGSSTSSQEVGSTWQIKYADGSGASGLVFADKVAVGAVTATSQAVEAATSVSSTFTQDTANDGLLGLAFSSINTVTPVKQTTFFDTVKSTLPMQLFTATLKHNAPGSYDFGYIDNTKYTGTIAYVPVITTHGFWEFAGPTTYSVGTGAQTAFPTTGGTSIADTGTTLLYLPSSVVSAYYRQVSGAYNSGFAGGYVFPCNAKLPNFNAVIGGQTRTVPGSYINYTPAFSSFFFGQYCFGGIQSSSGIGFNIFGDVFLKSQFGASLALRPHRAGLSS